jgi:aminopeptidase N
VNNRPPYRLAISDPRADSQYPKTGSNTLDALHYALGLTWNGRTRHLAGIAAIDFRVPAAESDVSLDFGPSLAPSQVTLDGRRVDATHPGAKLVVDTGPLVTNSRHRLRIRYGGIPRSFHPGPGEADLAGEGWNTETDGQVWTIQEPFGAYTWFPVDDQPADKAFYDITWHTKAAWTGVSNGQLVGDTVHHGERTARWELDSPAASYLVTAAIGPYRQYQQTGPHGLPLTYWVTPSDTAVLRVLRQSPAMLTWLEARLGRYPFASLGDVVVPTHSAVETQTMVTVGSPVLRSVDARADLLHEYVHQWYGDEVTPSTWRDLWLNETFAYYLQLVWEASHGVTTTAAWTAMLNHDDQQLRTAYGPPGEPKPADFAALNVYECGARMLERLRQKLGAAAFATALRGWPASRRFRSADRGDWIGFVDRATHRQLGGFITRWLTARTSPA